MTLVRRLGASLTATGLLLGLVACGSATSTAGGGQAPAVLTQGNFVAAVTDAQAQVDSAHIEATLEAAGQSGTLSGDLRGFHDVQTVAMDMSLDMAGHRVELVMVDKVLYVKGAGLSSDKPWVKVDLSDPNNPMASAFDSANPANFTAYLNGVSTIDDMGTETVDGVETRHYAVTVDTAKMLAANPAFKGSDSSRLGLPDSVTGDVYVDAGNLPIKIAVSMGSVASFEAHFSKYGESVDISAPPADQVSEFSF